MSLKEYRKKRNFNKTSEPKGGGDTENPQKLYVIQKHAASHLHYDLRLEIKGVLKSWAIPKGPHLNPSIKRLAVQVEDHPIEYGHFEGTIPEGEYGAGTVMLWDKGYWIPEGDANKAYQKGDLTFEIKAKKLKGKWKLIRIRDRNDQDKPNNRNNRNTDDDQIDRNNQNNRKNQNNSNSNLRQKKHWLFFKLKDKDAKEDYEIIEEKSRSVLSQKSMEGIAKSVNSHKLIKNHKKEDKQDPKNKKKNDKQEFKNKKKDNRQSINKKNAHSDNLNYKQTHKHNQNLNIKLKPKHQDPMPNIVLPELCFLSQNPPQGSDWIHEIKFDGYRMLAFLNQNKVKLISRNGLDWTEKLPELAEALKKMKIDNAILDGELVALDSEGKTNFQLLQNAFKENIAFQKNNALHKNSTFQENNVFKKDKKNKNQKKQNKQNRESNESNDNNYSQKALAVPLRYYLFDMPYHNNRNLSSLPLLERKKILKKMLNNYQLDFGKSMIFYSEHIQGKGDWVYKKACRLKLEGIVSKHINSPYVQARSKSWIKTKCSHRQEFVIGGFTDPKGSREGFGSLLVGLYGANYGADKKLIYHGHVGTGFDHKLLNSLHAQLKKIEQKANPFFELKDKSLVRNVHWVKPVLVAELEFTEMTKEQILRHPVFLGLRLDKKAAEVREDLWEDVRKEVKENVREQPRKWHGDQYRVQRKVLPKFELRTEKGKSIENTNNKNNPKNKPVTEPYFIENIKITHPNKVIDKKFNIHKYELCQYYKTIAPWILPYIINRPLSLLRCPSQEKTSSGTKASLASRSSVSSAGMNASPTRQSSFSTKSSSSTKPSGTSQSSFSSTPKSFSECFFHKHFTTGFEQGVYPLPIKEGVGKQDVEKLRDYLMIKNLQGLMALIQMNTMEIHPWGSKQSQIEKPDQIILDLDPESSVKWDSIIEAAFLIRQELKKLKLNSFVKMSGGKGLHITIPIIPEHSWSDIKLFTETFSHYLEKKHPERFVSSISKKKRIGKIFIDYLRNVRGATAVAPYSTRAKEGIPISMPVSWNDLKKITSAQQFNLSQILNSKKALKKDPWQGYFDCHQHLPCLSDKLF